MFAYCNNNLIQYSDEHAEFANYCLMKADGKECNYDFLIKKPLAEEGTVDGDQAYMYTCTITQLDYIGKDVPLNHGGNINEIFSIFSDIAVNSSDDVSLWGHVFACNSSKHSYAYFYFTDNENGGSPYFEYIQVIVKVEVSIHYRWSTQYDNASSTALQLSYELDGIGQSGTNGGSLYGISYAGGNPWIAIMR